ncbi:MULTISPECIES: hypothetical protein [Nostocales]|uniref:hypothetical protein n=1 Tax=Nostocales TaxID=1161 RepID=UPI001687763F|nr:MULTISPECIES: hypothetical protein [Nostocales]MBD2486393.1 hypothetical protein [Aulosira sp. FACHB-615]
MSKTCHHSTSQNPKNDFNSDYLGDPEEQPEEIVIALNAKSWQAAQRECAWHLYGQKFKVFQKKGRWYCTNKVD